MKVIKLALASALALGSASAFASTWTDGFSYQTSYEAAYAGAVAEAGELCKSLGGRPGPTVIVSDATYANGYWSVVVIRICFGV